MRFIGWLLLLFLGSSGKVRAEDPPDENPHYFPKGVFAAGHSDGDSTARWYARNLRALKEPSLFEPPQPLVELTYRFTWLRSWDPPIAIRVVIHADGTGTLTSKMTNRKGGYGPGKLTLAQTRSIPTSEVSRIQQLISAMDFWKTSTEPPANGTVVVDGAEWLLEGAKGADYHVIGRTSPESGPLHELGLFLIQDLSRLKIDPKRIY
jgi:hypothetical protein